MPKEPHRPHHPLGTQPSNQAMQADQTPTNATPRSTSSRPIPADNATFNTLVLESETPVIVDFWAEWCPPCRALSPLLEVAAADLGDRVSVVKVDADASPGLLNEYGVASIPTLVLFHRGVEVERRVGPAGLAPLKERALSLTD